MKVDRTQKVDSKTPQDPWSLDDRRQQVMKVDSTQKVDSKTPQETHGFGVTSDSK